MSKWIRRRTTQEGSNLRSVGHFCSGWPFAEAGLVTSTDPLGLLVFEEMTVTLLEQWVPEFTRNPHSRKKHYATCVL